MTPKKEMGVELIIWNLTYQMRFKSVEIKGIMNSWKKKIKANGIKLHLICRQRKRKSGKRMRWKGQNDRC